VPKSFKKSVHHFSVEFRVKIVLPVQILGANRRKSPTYSSLETSEIEVSLAAANFLPSMQMIVVSSLGRQPSKKIRRQLRLSLKKSGSLAPNSIKS